VARLAIPLQNAAAKRITARFITAILPTGFVAELPATPILSGSPIVVA